MKNSPGSPGYKVTERSMTMLVFGIVLMVLGVLLTFAPKYAGPGIVIYLIPAGIILVLIGGSVVITS